MKMIMQCIRRVRGFLKGDSELYVSVPYEWIISKSGQDIARLNDPEWEDMFWRRPILTPADSAPAGIDLFDDDYWADCAYQIRHATLNLQAPNVIIRGGKAPRVSVRGIPERITEQEWKDGVSNQELQATAKSGA
jgi:hypothetical protein